MIRASQVFRLVVVPSASSPPISVFYQNRYSSTLGCPDGQVECRSLAITRHGERLARYRALTYGVALEGP
jgi:hypothetical protein